MTRHGMKINPIMLAGLLLTMMICLSILPRLTPPASAQPGPVVVSFWHAMGGQKGEILQNMVNNFNRSHPEIRIDARFMGSRQQQYANHYSELYRQILENLARGNPPDMAQLYENWTTQLVEHQALVPLSTFIGGPNGMSSQELGDILPVFRQACTINGKLYTLPFNKSIYVLYYNRDIFQQYRLNPPATWDELRDQARRLTWNDGVRYRYGIVFNPDVDNFAHYLYAYGGDFIKGNQAIFNGNIGQEDLQYWIDMVNLDRSAMPSFKAMDAFLGQNSCMFIATSSSMPTLAEKAKFRYGIAPIPRGTTQSVLFAGTNLGIFAKSDRAKQEAAWQFMKWLCNKENTTAWALQTGYLPVRASAISGPTYQTFLRQHPDNQVGIQSLHFARVQPQTAAWEAIRGIVDDAMYQAISRQGSPQSILDSAVQKANRLLQQQG